MSKHCNTILLIIIMLIPNQIFCQNPTFFSDSIKARELNISANILGRQGMHTQALDTFMASLELREKLYGKDSYQLAPTYLGLGITYRAMGQLDQSLKYYEKAEKTYLNREFINNAQVAVLYINIGNIYREKLDYQKALQYFEQSIIFFNKDQEPSLADIAGVNYNIAEIYYVTNDLVKASKIINDNINNANWWDQIYYYELRSFINQLEGNLHEASNNYLKAIDLTISGYGDESLNVALEYLNYANFLITNNQFDEAEKILENAYVIIKKTQPEFGEILSNYYIFKGDLALNQTIESKEVEAFKRQKRNNIAESIIFYKKALTALRFPKEYSSQTLHTNEKPLSLMGCIRILKRLGDNYLELSEITNEKEKIISDSLSKAIESYQVVGSLIQQARKEISSDESKIQLTSLEYTTFTKLIHSAFNAYAVTNDNQYMEIAFQSAEKIKGSALFDKISDQFALENSLVPDSLLEQEKKLNSAISIFNGKLYEENSKPEPDSVLIAEYNNQIFNATEERERLNRTLENDYSDYYNLKYSYSMLSINDIQNNLSGDEVLLEYVFNETDSLTELYSFVISNKEAMLKKKIIKPDFMNSLENMFGFISNTEFMFTKNEDSKRFCTSSYHLYNELIEPIKDIVKNKNLIIIPDGKLSYIPFDALISSLPDTTRMIEFNKLNYLIRDICINYSISSNLLYKKAKIHDKPSIKALAFAPEYKENEEITVANKSLKLIQLPGVKEEVKQISDIVKTKLFIDEEATENNFRENAENCDILHLAMHAFINDSVPALSSMAFTLTNSSDSKQDGILNTADIYNLKLNARLTVLSACNTGIGTLLKGEGIMSLARGFLYAGCPSIVMSLWEVEDASGTEIMSLFYKNLKKGKKKDEALRAAKLEYLKSANSRRAHPHYWLGFVNIGDNTPLFMSYDYYFFIILILALLGIGIDQLIRIKKARKKRAL
ncbi:MAG: CHAT domain-containing tetratricopeptide repeat protein [Draconibacterium sp.]